MRHIFIMKKSSGALRWQQKIKNPDTGSTEYPSDPPGFTSSSKAIYDVLYYAARGIMGKKVSKDDVMIWLRSLDGEPRNLNSTIQAYKGAKDWQEHRQLIVRTNE